MKKTLKKIAGMVISAVTAFSAMGAPASFAVVEESMAENAQMSQSLKNYIEEGVPYLITTIGLKNPADCKITNFSQIYDETGCATGRWISFIIEDDNIVGDVVVATDENGNPCASAGLQEYPEINEAFKANKNISFFCIDGNLLMNCEGTAQIAYSEQDAADISNMDLSVLCAKTQLMQNSIACSRDLGISNAIASANITYDDSFLARAPLVGQGERGTCWAASVASKVTYDTQCSLLTADNVYDKVIACYPTEGIGSGRPRYIRGLSAYGIEASSFTGLLPYGALWNFTKNTRNLVIMRLKNDISGKKHAVVMIGYNINYTSISSSSYVLMDPNYKSGPRSVKITQDVFDGTEGFSYTSSIGTYQWFDSIYSN